MKDLGFISQEDNTNVIDRYKIRRHRLRDGEKQAHLYQKELGKVRGLYFDGKRDDTLTRDVVSSVGNSSGSPNHFKLKINKQEHVVLVAEPQSKYIGFVSPNPSNAETITAEILNAIKAIDSDIQVIGSDGTATNTGVHNGIIRRLEVALGKPVHWAICGLHFNELPLRAVFKHLDGETSGPRAFKGAIGRAIAEDIQTMNIEMFQPVAGKMPALPESVVADLSCDAKYLYKLSLAISTGPQNFPTDLKSASPGSLNHARWLTQANRVLRLYVSTKKPNAKLKQLVFYIQNCYAPTWFLFKRDYLLIHGSRNFFFYWIK